jgi:hypothetical protein
MPFLRIVKSGNFPKQQKFKEVENGRESKTVRPAGVQQHEAPNTQRNRNRRSRDAGPP